MVPLSRADPDLIERREGGSNVDREWRWCGGRVDGRSWGWVVGLCVWRIWPSPIKKSTNKTKPAVTERSYDFFTDKFKNKLNLLFAFLSEVTWNFNINIWNGLFTFLHKFVDGLTGLGLDLLLRTVQHQDHRPCLSALQCHHIKLATRYTLCSIYCKTQKSTTKLFHTQI